MCCSHYRFAASFLSGYKKLPQSKPHQFDNKLICYTIYTPVCCDFYLAACSYVCCVHLHVHCCRPIPPFSELHHSPRGCCHLAEHRLVVCSVCKPVHAADKLLAFRHPLIERQNTQIDSAVLGDLHVDTSMHALRYFGDVHAQTQ